MTETQTVSVQQILDAVESQFGFVPNVLREASRGPAALASYVQGQAAFGESTRFTDAEQQVIQLAVSAVNECGYCTRAHVAIGKGAGIAAEDLQAVLEGRAPGDARLAAVAQATRLVAEKRGWLDADDLEQLAEQGIDRAQIYEIVALVGLKTITNYINHIAKTKVDPELQ